MESFSFTKHSMFREYTDPPIHSIHVIPQDPLEPVNEHLHEAFKSPSSPFLLNPQPQPPRQVTFLQDFDKSYQISQQPRHSVSDDNDDDDNNSFYSAYLKVQEEKFQQQLQNLETINEKLRELNEELILPLPLVKREIKINVLSPPEKEEKDFGSHLVQFAYILGELVTIDSCKENIKLKLRFRLFDILQLFNLTSKVINRKEFHQNVSRVLGNTSHEYLDKLMRYIFGDRQDVNRQQFSRIFKSNKKEEKHDHSSQSTMQLVKEFFAALSEVLYFEEKLRKAASEIDSSRLQDAICDERSFSSEDIQRFTFESIKLNLDRGKVEDFFGRILKPRRSGDFLLSEFLSWLGKE